MPIECSYEGKHFEIDPQMPPLEKPVRLKRCEHHLENPLVNLRSESLPNHALHLVCRA